MLDLTSCKWFTNIGSPFFKWANIKIPEGPPAFQQGFKDGCSTLLYARGNIWYRMRYKYEFDPKMIGNPEYRFGHSRGYAWCFMNMVGTDKMVSFDRYIFPSSNAGAGGVFDMSATNLNVAWGGMFSNDIENPNAGLDAPIRAHPANGFNAMFDVWSGGSGGGVLSANPLWAGGSKGQFLGQ